MRTKVLALVLLAAATSTLAAPADPQIRVLVGGEVGLITDGDPQIEPLARVAVDWTVYGDDRPIRAHVIGDLTALPGDAIDVTDPASFRALEFSLGLSWKPVYEVGAALYATGGFASRFPSHGNDPVYEAPKWASFGVLFETKKRSAWLAVGAGPDQRLSGHYVVAVQVDGGLDLLKAEQRGSRLEGTSVTLLVNAVLGMERDYSAPTRRDVVRAGVCLGWGK